MTSSMIFFQTSRGTPYFVGLSQNCIVEFYFRAPGRGRIRGSLHIRMTSTSVFQHCFIKRNFNSPDKTRLLRGFPQLCEKNQKNPRLPSCGFPLLRIDHPHQRGGRLAQLVERLVYTEDVGGSSPSSPTIFLPAKFHLCDDKPPNGDQSLVDCCRFICCGDLDKVIISF